MKIFERADGAIFPTITTPAVRQGFVLFAANSIGNGLQYVYHIFASRLLGPDEYGVFTSLLALSVIVAVPAGIAQMLITQYVASFQAREETEKITALVMDSLGKLTGASFIAGAAMIAASAPIAQFLNVSSNLPVIATAGLFFFTGAITTFNATLQGLQRFYFLALLGIIAATVRVIFGLALIAAGLGVIGALGGSIIASVATATLAFIALRAHFRLPTRSHGLTMRAVSRYAVLVLGGMLALTVMTNIDLLIVKHFFTPAEAGYYSAATVLGKTILFFPGAIITLIFPKISRRFALGKNTADLARQSFVVMLGLCGFAALALYFFPAFAVRVLFGDQYDASIPLVGWYGFAMGLFALVQLLWTIYIAQEEGRFVILLLSVTSALALALWLLHANLLMVIASLGLSALTILIVSEIWLGGLGLVKHGM
ncbi:MAG: oligosaccharide flippase family protein [Chloroflexi bacterium]|nr:oligosaccharide flippase family protein [Chloroflexota bacterium]